MARRINNVQHAYISRTGTTGTTSLVRAQSEARHQLTREAGIRARKLKATECCASMASCAFTHQRIASAR